MNETSTFNRPPKKGKPTEKWGHKANGSCDKDGRVAGAKNQKLGG
jgi:hypothetical protein